MSEGSSWERGPWSRENMEPASGHKSTREQFEQSVDAIFKESKERNINIGTELEAMLVYASYFLNHPYAEMYEQFRVERNGSLTPLTERDISLSAWAVTSEAGDSYTTEDLRRAAMKFNERFPQIRFDFEENRVKGLFSYKATLPERV